jgi:glycosyltransferase involved in cell wall biosynthesis
MQVEVIRKETVERSPVSVLIPTYNEEHNLRECLLSVCEWVNQVFVVDSLSTDRTRQIADEFGVTVIQHRFEGFSQQKNWALDHMQLANEWVLILDADERVSPELAAEISSIVSADGNGYDGFYLNRKLIFYGKWIRHCGWYPSWNLRLFRHRHGRYEQREVHEHLLLEGKAGYCHHDLIHEDVRDMSFWIAKHNRYSSQEARELDRVRRGVSTAGLHVSLFKGSLERKRFIKERIWPHLPGRSFLLFFYLYFFRLGFLDGKHGFLFCQMHAIFEQFSTAKLWELEHHKQDAPEGAINAAKVFRSTVTVDAERSKK